jgi:hypothetical protein
MRSCLHTLTIFRTGIRQDPAYSNYSTTKIRQLLNLRYDPTFPVVPKQFQEAIPCLISVRSWKTFTKSTAWKVPNRDKDSFRQEDQDASFQAFPGVV